MMLKTVTLVFCLAIAGILAHNEPHPLMEWRVDHVTVKIDNAIALAASPDQLATSGSVTVSWSGVPNPNQNDLIAVFSPSTTQPNMTSPIKYKTAYSASGSGSVQFFLLNMRADYSFAFFRGGTAAPVLAARSNVVTFLNYNEPMGVHLSLTGNPGEVKVQWISGQVGTPYARLGLRPSIYGWTFNAVATTYTREEMCGAIANTWGWRDPGFLLTAIMTGLKPSTTYYYSVGDVWGFTADFSFTSPPVVGPTSNFNFFTFGDLGQTWEDMSLTKQEQMESSLNTTQALQADLTDQQLVVHIGDISYARGFASQWDNFMHQIMPVATRLQWMTQLGNHEFDWPGTFYPGTDSGGECGVAYQRRFPMPTPAVDEPWYSFDFGSVHFLLMSTEHDFTEGSKQRLFIETDLANVDRKRTPWVIFGGHRPMYVSSTNNAQPAGDLPVARALRASIEPLLFKYQVDLALWGHHHSYQRSCPVFNQTCVSGSEGQYAAPVHILTGAAGAHNSGNIDPNQPAWARFVNNKTHGFTRVTVTTTSMRFQYVSGLDRKILDDFTLQSWRAA